MTKDERINLAMKIMEEEIFGISPTVQSLGNEVLQEVLRLENIGEIEEAKAFEAFIPIDEDYLSSLAPILGQNEYEQTIIMYKQEKKRLRTRYLEQNKI